MDISKHLSTLLKFHECVIIPDFGGFISNYIPSRFDPFRNVFLPPTKEIVFNSKINKNDGLLINHLVETEAVMVSDALVHCLEQERNRACAAKGVKHCVEPYRSKMAIHPAKKLALASVVAGRWESRDKFRNGLD